MPVGTEWLNVLRIDQIMQGLVDTREMPKELLFLNRTPVVPASDNEILMRQISRVLISDVITHNARATVYTRGKATIESNQAPKIKHGYQLDELEIKELYELVSSGRMPAGSDWNATETRIMDDILTGIRQRQEQLLVSMALDSVTYDRLGIKITGSWGMPSDLKVTPQFGWADAANATPVNNLFDLAQVAAIRYGTRFNRMTMSTPAFQAMVATAEFQAKARSFLAPNVSYAVIPTTDVQTQKNLAMSIMNVDVIEFYDARYWSQDLATGTYSSAPYLPINKVILSSTSNDNNRAVQDFASGIVVEPMVLGLSGAGRLAAPKRGPLGYAIPKHDADPPDVTYWGVMCGFPRKKMPQANAVLDVGPIAQTVVVGEPF